MLCLPTTKWIYITNSKYAHALSVHKDALVIINLLGLNPFVILYKKNETFNIHISRFYTKISSGIKWQAFLSHNTSNRIIFANNSCLQSAASQALFLGTAVYLSPFYV